MIISRTPLRISFFGGGTDYPEFFRRHGGATLLTTIDQYCYISIHHIKPYFGYRFRASYAKTELVDRAEAFKHPLIRECLRHLGVRKGLEITHVSDLPSRTGLGTSSAFTVGLLHALHALRGERVTPEDLARESILVERQRVGDAGGHQDQYAAAYGGFIRLDFARDGEVRVERMALTGARVRQIESRLLMFYTGRAQSAEQILREQRRRTACNRHALAAMFDLVDEAERIVRGRGEVAAFGDLLHEAWRLKKSLSAGITNPVIDEAYATARKAGARGGKILGAGGRGFLLLFAEPERHAAIARRLPGLKKVGFAFSSEGSQIVFRTALAPFGGRSLP
jgi:D-glycero-alpha-D-manno-heptose-7-phosphate kinase